MVCAWGTTPLSLSLSLVAAGGDSPLSRLRLGVVAEAHDGALAILRVDGVKSLLEGSVLQQASQPRWEQWRRETSVCECLRRARVETDRANTGSTIIGKTVRSGNPLVSVLLPIFR